MKKIFIFLTFSLLTIYVNGQSILNASSVYQKSFTAASSYCAEYQAVYNAMTTKPSTYDGNQNTLVEDLKTAGIWVKLDCFYVFAQESNGASEALLNWINPTGDDNCTNVHATAFVANEGFTGDGINDYLNTNFNPSTEGVTYLQDAASFGAYWRLDLNENTYNIGASDGTYGSFIMNRAGGQQTDRVNSNNNNGWAVATGNGFHCAVRAASNHHHTWYNGTDKGTDTRASTGVPNANFIILGMTAASATNQVSIAFIGGALSDAEMIAFNTAVEKFMDAIGKGVE